MTVDMGGKVCLVTGANCGIGAVTARTLAQMGATVFMACRSEERTLPVVEEIRAATGNARVEMLQLDLGQLASVHACAEAFLARGVPLHVLVNNAGIAGARGVTGEGFELAFGTNHLGHWVLTQRLLDRLIEGAPARVVTVASQAHYRAQGIDWEAVREPTRSFTGMPEYATSKLANVLFSAELHRRAHDRGISTYSLHPGVVASEVWRRVPWPFRSIMKTFMISSEEGAETTLHCATSPDVADRSGLYWDECTPKTPGRAARDEDLARELWERSAAWTGVG